MYWQGLTNQNHLKMLLASCRVEREECVATLMAEKEKLMVRINNLKKKVAKQKLKLDESVESKD